MKRIKNRAAYFFINLRFFLRNIFLNNKFLKINSKVKEFEKHGIIKIGVPGISEYLLSMIGKTEYINQNKSDLDIKIINQNEHGIKGMSVDICSDFLWKYVFTKEIYEILLGYYKGDFYLRNNPVIVFNYDGETHGAQAYHLDWGLRQTSIMINLTDVIAASTQMTYLLKSNKSYWFKHPNRESDKFKKMVLKYKSNNPNCSYNTQSNRDTLFIFDAGNGFHRQVPGGQRIMLHLNFVDNLAFTEWDKNWEPASNSQKEVWFSNSSKKIDELILKSGLPSKMFSLVLQNHKPGILTPLIFSKNFEKYTSVESSLSMHKI